MTPEHEIKEARAEQQTEVFAPPLGDPGVPCTECGAPLAADQRYCLNCGRRRADARLPFVEVLESRFRGANPVVSEQLAAPPPRRAAGGAVPWAAGAFGAGLLALGIVIGAVLDDEPKQVAAARPQVISVATPAAAGAAAAPVEEQFTADWPEGTEGFTIELQTIAKDGTPVADVAAAKTAATGKGATDVGALDSDEYASLDGGNYVIYSGIFDTRKQARKALGRLKKKFPDARVIEVSSSGGGDAAKKGTVDKSKLEDLKSSSPEEYQKKSKKLPDETKLPGKAPPKDNKKPGGGSGGGETIE
jgi:hypothetical protein